MTHERTPEGPARHLDLIGAARAVQRAATDEDLDALHDAVMRLRDALVDHASGCRFDCGDDRLRRLARRSQHRLLHVIDEVLSATRDGVDACTCVVRSAEVRSLLIRQLRLEARAAPR